MKALALAALAAALFAGADPAGAVPAGAVPADGPRAPCAAPVLVEGHGVPQAVVDELAHAAPALEGQVAAALQPSTCAPIHVVLLPAIEGARALEPPWQLPDWAAGAAEPGDRRIVVAVTAKGERQDRARVLLHELAHVGVHDAARDQPVPRWLDEGIARFVSNEPEDQDALARARIGDRLLPLAALARGFPDDGASASLASAESARAVQLVARTAPDALPRLLAEVGRGVPVDDALHDVAGRRTWQLDNDVEDSIPLARAWAIIGMDSELAYGLAALATAWAGVRARRQLKRRMSALDDVPLALWALPVASVGLRRWTVRG